MRKQGLTNHNAFLLRACDDRKATLGVIELSRMRVHIDFADCYVVVGSSHPGCAEAAKGTGVHRLKGVVSWVQYAARQYGFYLVEVFGDWVEDSFSTRGTRNRRL